MKTNFNDIFVKTNFNEIFEKTNSNEIFEKTNSNEIFGKTNSNEIFGKTNANEIFGKSKSNEIFVKYLGNSAVAFVPEKMHVIRNCGRQPIFVIITIFSSDQQALLHLTKANLTTPFRQLPYCQISFRRKTKSIFSLHSP